MFIRPRVLSILTTRRCTAACDHCCVGASPRATDAIPIERIHGLIDEAKRIPSIERIVFTGGECFLLGHDLDALIAHAHELEFETRVITNGYWALSPNAAKRRIQSARIAGLDEVVLSTGTFHQRFVPVNRVIHAARAAVEAMIPTRLSVEVCDQSEFDDAILRRELADELASGRLYLAPSPWIYDAGGRGSATLSHVNIMRDGSYNERCEEIMTVISVTPRQELVSCCGFPLEELPNLTIGSVVFQSLETALQSAPNQLLKMWLHVAGPVGIAEFVARHVPGFRLPSAASICESCVALQRNDIAMKTIARHGGEAVDAIAGEFVRLHLAS